MLYWIGYYIFKFFFKIYFRVSAYGVENIPKSGPCLIVANHVSFFDPPLVGTRITNRQVYFLARDTLFRNPVSRFILQRWNSIPINRGAGFMDAFDKALTKLKDGNLIIAFPEGTRSKDGLLQKAKPGIGLLAYTAKVTVVPCMVKGAYEAMPKGRKLPAPKKITLFYGKPIDLTELYSRPASKDVYKKISDIFMKNIESLDKK
jgi:1-acyl-sn-glycerol-3-phosphate acyltransferase